MRARQYLLNTQLLKMDPFRLEGTLSLPLSLKFNFEQVTDFKESTMSAWEEIVRLQQDLERVQAAGAVQVEIGCT